MKTNLFQSSVVAVLTATAAMAQDPTAAQPLPRYAITDLGPVGTPFSQVLGLNNLGLAAGLETAADGTQHAVLWYRNVMTDISKPGLGGPNSAAGGINESGLVMGQAETSDSDPNKENFCGYGADGLQCVAFVWQNGVIAKLPTLGGANATFGQINNRGEVGGIAENSHHDTNEDTQCRSEASVNGTGPQFLDFEAVIWGPAPGEMRELPPLPGDTVGMALGINDGGEAVGVSGTCANTVLPGFVAGPHAVLWDKDGLVHDLGSFGGTSNPSVLAVGNAALAINNKGQVVGTSAMSGNLVNQPFVWTKETGMQHLPLLSGDVVGAGLAINNTGDAVGASITPGGAATGTPTAVLWRGGVVNDLNDLAADSPLQLITACAIDDSGQIGGLGLQASTGEIHSFLATPCGVDPSVEACKGDKPLTTGKVDQSSERPTVVLPEDARKVFLRLGLGGR